MSEFEKHARNILNKYGCTFIRMISESSVMWENQSGIIRIDDIFVLSNMNESSWRFFSFN